MELELLLGAGLEQVRVRVSNLVKLGESVSKLESSNRNHGAAHRSR